MSNGSKYLPIPPRVWSRVQNQCTYTVDSSYNLTYIPLINKTLMPLEAAFYDKQLYKGNILQYKGNSTRITKNQKYSQIAKGLWSNRTKVFATQSQTYTNPNTTSLKRVNYATIPYPNQIPGSPNNISGPYQYNVPNPYNCSTESIQDGGNLVCNAYVNPCSGEVIQNVSQQQCFPTYCSDVPGEIMDLCWNPKLQTWFPKPRYVMNNSTNKWPEGYKGFVSAITPDPPVLLTAIGGCGSVELSWSYVSNPCIPISSFRIYVNNILVTSVSYKLTSFTVENLNFNTSYTFYMTSLSYTTESSISNSLSTTTLILPSPTNLLATPDCQGVILNWTEPSGVCSSSISSYDIYYDNGTFVTSVFYPNTSTIISNINFNASYSFYIKSHTRNSYSVPSNTANVITDQLNIPTLSIFSYNAAIPGVTFTLAPGNSGCITSSYSYNLYKSINGGTYNLDANITGNGNVPQNQPYILNYNTTYNFYIKYVANNNNQSPASLIVAVNTNFLSPTNLTATNITTNSVYLSWTNPTNTNFILGYNIYVSNGITIPVSSSTTNYTVTGITPGTSYNFYLKSYNNGSTSGPSNIVSITTLPVYIQTGATNVYNNNGYTGIVFDYPSSGQTITINSSVTLYILAVGGGGGGGLSNTSNIIPGGGGAGGGIYYSNHFPYTPTQTYTISVGNGGQGCTGSTANYNISNNGQNGGTTTISLGVNAIITATYGAGSNGANGGPGGSGYDTYGNTYSGNGGEGATGNSLSTPYRNGLNSSIPILGDSSLNLPFTTPPNSVLNISGGGGSGIGNNNNHGGLNGLGNGGNGGDSSSGNGVSAPNSIANNSGYGGGGGGCPYDLGYGHYAGNGGNGVVIFWFQNP